jgi:MFS family permease
MVLVTIGNAFIALTPDAAILGLTCLLIQQLLSDSSITAFDVVAMSIRQATVADRSLGRVGASFHVLEMAAMLVGTVIGGVVAELIGVRVAVVLGSVGGIVAIVVLWFSAIRHTHEIPTGPASVAAAVIAGEDVPLSE